MPRNTSRILRIGHLKPANVLMTTGGTAKVMDFGLASVIGPLHG